MGVASTFATVRAWKRKYDLHVHRGAWADSPFKQGTGSTVVHRAGNFDDPRCPGAYQKHKKVKPKREFGGASAIARKLACTGRKQITVFALGSLLGKGIAEKSPPTVSAVAPLDLAATGETLAESCVTVQPEGHPPN